ncbi:MAG: LysR family transcriptional regulator [Eubacteriales bacterium]|nr:LysR family transcriptional regulator [Eubacteriales bacterium]
MKTFLQVCRDMNYTKAAEHLCITQPAVTHHIKYLEQTYGAQLFTFEGKKLKLTQAGEFLLDSARKIQNDEKFIEERIQAIDGRKVYNFGATLTAAGFFMPERLIRFMKRDRNTHICMVCQNTDELLRELNNGEIDFAVVEGDFPKDKYSYFVMSDEEFIAAAAPEIARKYDGKKTEDMLGERLLLREPKSGTREILEHYLNELGLSIKNFDNVAEIASIAAIRDMTAAGLGVSFVYQAAFSQEIEKGTIAKVNLTDFKIKHPISFIYRKGTIFDDDFREIYRSLQS